MEGRMLAPWGLPDCQRARRTLILTMKNQTTEDRGLTLRSARVRRPAKMYQSQRWRRQVCRPDIQKHVLPLPGSGKPSIFPPGGWFVNLFPYLESNGSFLWLTGSSKTHLCPFIEWISQANTTVLFVSQPLCCAGNEGSTLDQPGTLIYSTGTAGHLSCNKNKMSLWPRASSLLLNPHFKESYYMRVGLNQTKLQCLRTVAHFQISLSLTTSPSETQLGAEQSDPVII